MKVLVTGVKGQLGHDVMNELEMCIRDRYISDPSYLCVHFPAGVDLDFVRKGQGGADGQSDGLLAKDMDP